MPGGWYKFNKEQVQAIRNAICLFETLVDPEAKIHSYIETLDTEALRRNYHELKKVYHKIKRPGLNAVKVFKNNDKKADIVWLV